MITPSNSAHIFTEGVSKVKWAWTLGERRVTVVQYVSYTFKAEHRATRQARLGTSERAEEQPSAEAEAGDDQSQEPSSSSPQPPRFPRGVQILNPDNS